jgi:hypothetical protein
MMIKTPDPDETTPEDFLDQAGLGPPAPVMSSPSGKRVKKSLRDGAVEGVEMRPEEVTQTKTRLMKIVSLTRTPDQHIAVIELRVRGGKLYELEIDEATSRAIASVFDP